MNQDDDSEQYQEFQRESQRLQFQVTQGLEQINKLRMALEEKDEALNGHEGQLEAAQN